MNLSGGIFIVVIVILIIVSRLYRLHVCRKTENLEIKPGVQINVMDIRKLSGIMRVSRNNITAKISFQKDSFHFNTGFPTGGEERRYIEIEKLEKNSNKNLNIKFRDGYKLQVYFITPDQRDRVFNFLNK